MEKNIAALIGALAGLATMGSAQAAIHSAPNPSAALRASSYAELLAPVPDAVALLKADDATRMPRPVADDLDGAQLAQEHHHHQQYRRPQSHHHHHRRYRRPQSHHHHHQQQ
jgi:hypothetical protein